MEISFYPSKKNAQEMEKVFREAGLKGVRVTCRCGYLPYSLEGGERINGSDDVAGGKLTLNIGNRCRVVIRDLHEGAALVRTWWYDYYSGHGGGYFLRDGIQLLVMSDEEGKEGVTVIRVPWKTKSVAEAREFAARYRFFNHFVGAGREKSLKRRPYTEIA